MKDERYQFFELKKRNPRMASWEHKFFLDRETQQVYLPVVDSKTQFIALLDDKLTQVNGRPYCRLRLYAEHFPELRDGLLALEQRVKAAA